MDIYFVVPNLNTQKGSQSGATCDDKRLLPLQRVILILSMLNPLYII